MKRKTVSILLVATLISSLTVGCGKKEADTTATEKVEATEVIETESTETTEAVETENTETTEVAETETQEPTETAEQSPYSYTDMSATMYAQRAVNVRDLPDTSGNKVGGLSTNDEVAVTGKCNETGWYRISYNGSEAFVSNNNLGENKVEVKQATQSASEQSVGSQQSTAGQEATASNLSNCPYTLNKIFDDGGDYVYYYYVDTVDSMNGAAKEAMYNKGYDDNNIVWDYEEVGTFAEGHVLKCVMKQGQWNPVY